MTIRGKRRCLRFHFPALPGFVFLLCDAPQCAFPSSVRQMRSPRALCRCRAELFHSSPSLSANPLFTFGLQGAHKHSVELFRRFLTFNYSERANNRSALILGIFTRKIRRHFSTKQTS